MLAAWLAVYAAGNLMLIADAGLHFRAINRFLSFKSAADCDGRTARFYAAMLRIYLGLAGALTILLVAGTQLLRPAAVLGFEATPDFDTAFLVMTIGTLAILPSSVPGALYRARGFYGRSVWLQCLAMLVAQIAQLMAIAITGSLLAVALAYMLMTLMGPIYIVGIDAVRLFPFLRGASVNSSWRWIAGQFRAAFPFAVASTTDTVLQFAPVLLVSAFVSDRVAVAQWALTRVIAGLLRALCQQTTLPLAAELGHDYATGAKEKLRSLYARGSVLAALLTGLAASGLLAFWPDFFALWTRNAIPYDPMLTLVLLIGATAAAPSILAVSYAVFSNRAALLARTKALQLVVFLILSVALIRPLGPTGAAIAIVTSDLLVQFGILGLTIIRQTLRQPFRHIAFVAAMMAVIIVCGWGLGTIIRTCSPGAGMLRFVGECAVWLLIVAVCSVPLLNAGFRNRLVAGIPD